MSFFLNLNPILTIKQIERMANIFDNAGQVLLGVAVLSPLIADLDKINLFVIISGIIGMLICWTVSVLLTRRLGI